MWRSPEIGSVRQLAASRQGLKQIVLAKAAAYFKPTELPVAQDRKLDN
jgi:hypothetical protein